MVLVDTSVWVEFFRKDTGFELEEFVSLEEVVTCLPVVQEVVQGFREPEPHRVALRSMLAFPIVESPMSKEVFLEAAELYRTARRNGLTVRSSVDCLIAACAIRNSVSVLHLDRDFTHLARVSALEQRSIQRAEC